MRRIVVPHLRVDLSATQSTPRVCEPTLRIKHIADLALRVVSLSGEGRGAPTHIDIMVHLGLRDDLDPAELHFAGVRPRAPARVLIAPTARHAWLSVSAERAPRVQRPHHRDGVQLWQRHVENGHDC